MPIIRCIVSIKPDGWANLELLKKENPDSQQGFIAIWFGEEVSGAAQAIRAAIDAAGFEPKRVDDVEHEGKIDDRIITEITRSRFVVADYTEHLGGVYYEAGFAHGFGLTVFFTCRKDMMEGLHFDIRQYNCIDWKTEGELQERLRDRITAVFG